MPPFGHERPVPLRGRRAENWAEREEDPMAGLYFEDFEIGRVFRHEMRRTVTEADNVWFSMMTGNPAAIHIDEDYCQKHTEFGQRIVNSAFTLGLVVGMTVGDTTLGTTVGNLGFEECRFPRPVFHGDTIRSETEVLDKRESRSRPGQGIVTFLHRGYNQHGDLVVQCKRPALMLCAPATS
ncbi:MaoC family dehydratase [Alterinioella nitratireducens]|uniref:MaoC family dehydratase n=1 Tax=Alterinioella nitratireducens TaxID=2735915 RepID=UPI0038B27950